MYELVTGDDVSIPVTLKQGADVASLATFTINPSATVTACIVSTGKNEQYSAEVTCNNAATGADWANSLVIVEFTSAQTNAITHVGTAMLEIQVNDSGKTTYYQQIKILSDTIA